MKFLSVFAAAFAVTDAAAVENKFVVETGDRNAYGCVHDRELKWMVTVVLPGQQAEQNNVQIGDRLLAINGETTANLVVYTLYEKMEQRPLELTYVKGRRGTEPCTEEAMRSLNKHVSKEGKLEDMYDVLEKHVKCDLDVLVAGEELPLIHKAAEIGDRSKIRVLRHYGASVITSVAGKTPLHRAVVAGDVLSVSYLVDFGADPGTPDGDGWPAVHLATINCKIEVIKSLRLKTTPDGKDKADLWAKANGKTPEELAVEHGCENLVAMLQRWGKTKKETEEDEWKKQQAAFASKLKGGEL